MRVIQICAHQPRTAPHPLHREIGDDARQRSPLQHDLPLAQPGCWLHFIGYRHERNPVFGHSDAEAGLLDVAEVYFPMSWVGYVPGT